MKIFGAILLTTFILIVMAPFAILGALFNIAHTGFEIGQDFINELADESREVLAEHKKQRREKKNKE